MKKFYAMILSVLLGMSGISLGAQELAVKTNLLYDATATMNAGVEFGIPPKWTVDVTGALNPFTFNDGKRWKLWMVQPEVRYWLCQRFGGHFFALHGLGGQFNFGYWDTDFEFLGTDFSKLKDARYQGWYVGAGLGYGYAWMLGKHWNLEAELGIGWVHFFDYDKYRCVDCDKKIAEDMNHDYFGPTKAAISLVYTF
jgi:hypothetical protein